MFYKLLAAILLALGFTTAARAEINSDTGCDSSGAWMTQPSSSSGWSISGSKCVGSSVTSMHMLMQMAPQVKEGHKYRISGTASGVSAGSFRFVVGVNMPPSAPAGSYIPEASVSSIADNFNTADGIESGGTTESLTSPGHSEDDIGATRFVCTSAGHALKDPLVYPGLQSPHLHEGYGNTGWIHDRNGKSWVYSDFRSKGGSTCGNRRASKNTPINRSGYWIPAMLDGEGSAVQTQQITLYYKGPPRTDWAYTGTTTTPQLYCPEMSPTATCRSQIPFGLRMTFGYKSSTGLCGPTDVVITDCTIPGAFDCWSKYTGDSLNPPAQYTAEYTTLKALMEADVCTPGSLLRVNIVFPYCWDGVNIDTPDHRSHLSYGLQHTAHFGNGGCDSSHPVAITTISIQSFYLTDAAFRAHKWRLSSDEMIPGFVAGQSLHGDYWEGWSPTALQTFALRCIFNHGDCSNSSLGDGTRIKDGQGVNFDGTDISGSGGAKPLPGGGKVPTRIYGMSKDFTANGTFSVDITAPGSGTFGIIGLGGFTGSLDNIHIVEVSQGSHG